MKQYSTVVINLPTIDLVRPPSYRLTTNKKPKLGSLQIGILCSVHSPWPDRHMWGKRPVWGMGTTSWASPLSSSLFEEKPHNYWSRCWFAVAFYHYYELRYIVNIGSYKHLLDKRMACSYHRRTLPLTLILANIYIDIDSNHMSA